MASSVKGTNGRRMIQFTVPDGRRRSLRLGKVSAKQAISVRVRVEELLSAKITGEAPPKAVSDWLAGLDDTLLSRLAAVGLTDAPQLHRLGAWVLRCIEDRASRLKPASIVKLRQTHRKLIEHIDPQLAIRKITADQAAEWETWLRTLGLSEAAVRIHIGNAKSFFLAAVRRGLMEESPFQHLKGGATPSQYRRYVTPEEIAKVIDACPDSEWRLWFGLARYAGVRVPSESHRITLADVDWTRGRLTVRSPKTERHIGGDVRIVPIDRRLMPLLLDRREALELGRVNLVGIGGGWIYRQVAAIQAAAGVAPWERLWQTLRASCEMEWALTFPQYVVSLWIGHSITISGRHYANEVPDELFDRAAGVAGSAQNPTQPTAARPGNDPKPDEGVRTSDLQNSGGCG